MTSCGTDAIRPFRGNCGSLDGHGCVLGRTVRHEVSCSKHILKFKVLLSNFQSVRFTVDHINNFYIIIIVKNAFRSTKLISVPASTMSPIT